MRSPHTIGIRGIILGCVLAAIAVPACATNWAQSYLNAGHTGYNSRERTLSTIDAALETVRRSFPAGRGLPLLAAKHGSGRRHCRR